MIGYPYFDFGSGDEDIVALESYSGTSTISWNIRRGSAYKDLLASSWDAGAWTHVVVTVSGSTMKMYENGYLAGTKTDGHTPYVLTRTRHFLGRSYFDIYFNGSIAYFKMWHNKELSLEEVRSGYCPSGKYGLPEIDGTLQCAACPKGKYSTLPSTMDCTVCAAGKYQSAEGSSSCTGICVSGKYLTDDGINAEEHDSEGDCLVCSAG